AIPSQDTSELHSTTDAPPAVPLKVTDFGLARQLDESGQTSSGAVMGTPSYLAPEQASGRSKEARPPADIYPPGAARYELLAGRRPFGGETAMETIGQVLNQEPAAPRRHNARVPADLEVICLKCLEKEPRKRYRTAAALADDLRQFLRGAAIAARRV